MGIMDDKEGDDQDTKKKMMIKVIETTKIEQIERIKLKTLGTIMSMIIIFFRILIYFLFQFQ